MVSPHSRPVMCSFGGIWLFGIKNAVIGDLRCHVAKVILLCLYTAKISNKSRTLVSKKIVDLSFVSPFPTYDLASIDWAKQLHDEMSDV